MLQKTGESKRKLASHKAGAGYALTRLAMYASTKAWFAVSRVVYTLIRGPYKPLAHIAALLSHNKLISTATFQIRSLTAIHKHQERHLRSLDRTILQKLCQCHVAWVIMGLGWATRDHARDWVCYLSTQS
jgi:hypothetical protein